LRYLDAVDRERHFGRAAAACCVSQPTLSAGIAKLEANLGVQLFERGRRGVRATPAGERLVVQARKVLEEARAFEQLAAGNNDPLTGPLRVGVIYSIGPYLLPRLLPPLHQRAPAMPIILEENYTARLAEKLERGDLDVIVIALPFAAPHTVTQVVYEEDFVVALPNAHALVKKKRISADMLESEKLIVLGAGHCFRDQVLQACPACQHGSNDDVMEGSSLETICHMVAGGIGVTVLPHSSAAHHAHNKLLTIRPMQQPAPKRQVALAWRKAFPRPEAVELLRHAILDCGLEGVRYAHEPAIRFR
jgi:LysR family hydrogen peroxide-inducible transcriptional activator